MTPQDIIGIRRELKMTQQEFANTIGASTSIVRKWENGQRNISKRMAQVVRDASLRGNRQTVTVKSGEVVTIIGR